MPPRIAYVDALPGVFWNGPEDLNELWHSMLVQIRWCFQRKASNQSCSHPAPICACPNRLSCESSLRGAIYSAGLLLVPPRNLTLAIFSFIKAFFISTSPPAFYNVMICFISKITKLAAIPLSLIFQRCSSGLTHHPRCRA